MIDFLIDVLFGVDVFGCRGVLPVIIWPNLPSPHLEVGLLERASEMKDIVGGSVNILLE